MSKLIHTTLKDICLKEKGSIISGPFGSNISSKFFVEDGVPVEQGKEAIQWAKIGCLNEDFIAE